MTDSTLGESKSTVPASTHNSIIYLALILAFVQGAIYAAVVPPWQAPDEPAHFERVRAALVTEELQAIKGYTTWYIELRDSLYFFFYDTATIDILAFYLDASLG